MLTLEAPSCRYPRMTVYCFVRVSISILANRGQYCIRRRGSSRQAPVTGLQTSSWSSASSSSSSCCCCVQPVGAHMHTSPPAVAKGLQLLRGRDGLENCNHSFAAVSRTWNSRELASSAIGSEKSSVMSPKDVVEEEVVLLSSTSCWKKGEHTKDFQCLFKTRNRRISFSGNRANAISNVFSGSLLHRKASIATAVVSTVSSAAPVANCLTISKLLCASNLNHKAC